MKTQCELEKQLNSYDAAERREALKALSVGHADALREESTNVNMHCHSFFSYNADGFSPSRIARDSRKAGLYAVGLCDFDVLDGLEEFLAAGQRLGLRATVRKKNTFFEKVGGLPPMSERKAKALDEKVSIPLGRSGKLNEVADTVCFLASDRAAYIHGTTVNVSGGKSRR